MSLNSARSDTQLLDREYVSGKCSSVRVKCHHRQHADDDGGLYIMFLQFHISEFCPNTSEDYTLFTDT